MLNRGGGAGGQEGGRCQLLLYNVRLPQSFWGETHHRNPRDNRDNVAYKMSYYVIMCTLVDTQRYTEVKSVAGQMYLFDIILCYYSFSCVVTLLSW